MGFEDRAGRGSVPGLFQITNETHRHSSCAILIPVGGELFPPTSARTQPAHAREH